MESLYNLLGLLNSQPECRTCQLCEEHVGLVYLLGGEATKVTDRQLPVLNTSRGVQYLGRTREGWCSSFDPGTNRCRIYDDRPLCCRIYPLDLMKLEDEVWWVIHSECPIAQRFKNEHRLSMLAAITVTMETALSDEELRHWLTEDKTSQEIEAFSFEVAKVIKLRRYGEEVAFPYASNSLETR